MAEQESIKKDFSFLFNKKEVLAVLLYGSVVKEEQTLRSDIDVCIVAPASENKAELLKEVYRNVDVFSKKYDVRIFEELPLYIQIQIIQNHEVVYTKDIYEMHEYFYYIRKLWEDQASRQHMTKEELGAMLEQSQ